MPSTYPKLLGEGWPVTKEPVFSTIVQESASGMETRIGQWSLPRFVWTIPYAYLAQDVANPLPNSVADIRTLMGFMMAAYGQLSYFLFDDVTDNFQTGAVIGTGDGATTAFQLQRQYGAFSQPVYDIKSSPAAKIYKNGVLQSSGYTIGATGVITFSSAPAGGVAITADFGWYWRVRFKEDSLEFSNDYAGFWSLSKVKLYGVRG